NGRFLCTHPLGLSSGRFPSVFRVSNLTRSVFQSVSGPNSVSGPLLERGLPSSYSLSGFTNFIRSFSAELIGLLLLIRR
ncbi:hypothetical protein ACPCTO_05415, partial [Streptomyces olivoreticuli]